MSLNFLEYPEFAEVKCKFNPVMEEGVMPFAPGKPCSKCDSDQTCFRGLCKEPLVNDKTGFCTVNI